MFVEQPQLRLGRGLRKRIVHVSRRESLCTGDVLGVKTLHGVVLELESLQFVAEHPGLDIDTDVWIDGRGLVYGWRVTAVVHPLDEECEDAGVVFEKGDADYLERSVAVTLVCVPQGEGVVADERNGDKPYRLIGVYADDDFDAVAL